MRKAHIAGWAAITVAVGVGLFAAAVAIINQQKSAGHYDSAQAYLAAPIFVQLILWLAAAAYGRRRGYPEISAGILTGFVVEALALGALVVFASLAHY